MTAAWMRLMAGALAMLAADGAARAQTAPAAPATTPAAPIMKPAGAWVVNFGAVSCFAGRRFGAADEMVEMLLLADPGLQSTTIELVLPDKPPADGLFELTVPGRDTIASGGYRYARITGTDRWRVMASTGLPLDKLAEASALTIRMGRGKRWPITFTLNTGSLKPLNSAITQCDDDLLKGWGLDPTLVRDSARRAAAMPPGGKGPGRLIGGSDWFVPDDLALGLVMEGHQGLIGVAWIIDETGIPIACHITRASGVDALDKATCDIVLKRARYVPFVDAQGKAHRMVASRRIIWMNGR